MERNRFEHINWPFIGATLTLITIGLLNLYSATYRENSNTLSSVFTSQALWVGLGILFIIIINVFDYRILERIAWPLYIFNIGLLIYVLFYGRIIGGSQRWIDIGFLNLQPSELMKFTLIVILAKYFHDDTRPEGYSLRDLILPAMILGLPAILVLKEPDLGTTLLLVMIFFSIIAFVGLKVKSIIQIVISVLITIPFAWFFLLKEYQKARIRVFLDPSEDKLGNAWHITQCMIAIGSGKTSGKGFLDGTQSKLEFVPKQHTDFIFSVFAEEWGFIGCIALMALFLLFLFLGLHIASKARDRFGGILGVGIVSMLFFQILVNISMELSLMPVVGVTLPFFSYGGSAIIMTLLGVGLLININLRRYLF